jgi:hypothetical protein
MAGREGALQGRLIPQIPAVVFTSLSLPQGRGIFFSQRSSERPTPPRDLRIPYPSKRQGFHGLANMPR